VAFFLIALSGDVYNLTSPPDLSFHVLLRKSYSIVAFALVGGAFVWASGASLRTAATAIALYSGGIEVAQHFTNGREPFSWNVIDVICGAIGGALGAVIPWFRAK
jgi:VanZ family protein